MDPSARALGAETHDCPAGDSTTEPVADRTADQPTAHLSTAALVRLAAYWLGLAALCAGLSPILAGAWSSSTSSPPAPRGVALFQMMAVGGLLAIVIRPGVGAISDHTTSRWGAARAVRLRREPARRRLPARFVAVDWALLSELVPRASAGRFMGISNVASGSAGILSVALGGTVMDLVGGATRDGSGPRAALALGGACILVGAVLLSRVREPGRG